MSTADENTRQEFDTLISEIADYVVDGKIEDHSVYDTARYCLLDSMSCMFLALKYPACTKLLGPIVPGASLETGARIPGTDYVLEPVHAAFNIGALIRWLDFNDTWLAEEWGHPSDNLGGILAVADYMNQSGTAQFTVHDVLTYAIKAHEIQGVLALKNCFNRVGLNHVLLVRIATTAVTAHMLGCNKEQITNAISHAWADGGALRTYRHAPNTGSRKSWAAGDATSRGVRLALIAKRDEMGYPSILTAPKWGFQDVLMDGKSLLLERPLGSYVMKNVLFKISFPAEFHAQTAVECALKLHPEIKERIDEIERIDIQTQESAVRIINKSGPLYNPADRDHCLQYMVAIGLLHGDLNAGHYEDEIAKDPLIDALREKMAVSENTKYTQDYLDPEKRAIANSIQIFMSDGSSTERVEVHYPIGHERRRKEGIPVLLAKFKSSLEQTFSKEKAQTLYDLGSSDAFLDTPINDLMTQISEARN